MISQPKEDRMCVCEQEKKTNGVYKGGGGIEVSRSRAVIGVKKIKDRQGKRIAFIKRKSKRDKSNQDKK